MKKLLQKLLAKTNTLSNTAINWFSLFKKTIRQGEWFFIILTRWVKLNDLNFDIINWSVKDKFIDILH